MAALPAHLGVPGDRPVLVGLSGGLDSIVLLHALAATTPRPRLRALHVHHGLHADADQWASHCGRACAALGVPLIVRRVEVAAGSGLGPEAAAREARHAAFDTELGFDEVLALAHHREDQAETFLLRALRGAGVDGLAAMRAWRRFGRGWLWRPLLEVPRAALADYARAHALAWIDDPSNADPAFDRNFLRHHVLPRLRERWPHADAALARSASLAFDAAGLLATEDAQALAAVRTIDPHVLDADALQALPAARRARVLRAWIAALGLPQLTAEGSARIEAGLMEAAPADGSAFEWSGAVVRRWRGLLHAARARAGLPDDWSATWDGHDVLPLPDGGRLALEGADAFEAPLQVRPRRGGERIALAGRAHSHALKHVLQDLGVPPWERMHLPLLLDGDTVLAAGDLVHAGAFEAWLQDRDARLAWLPPRD